ncbi:MAG: Fe-S cluster assembly scaffold protein NifU [Thermodesulfobacteriota bacterium]|nr:MAG: Fe-S cluster assembly scaffold protein NifU [Thermodesulfobacteriota bacterium]
MYSEKVIEHFSNPKNAGVIEDADGIGEVGNPVCGDMMTFYIKVKDEKLADVKFQTFGCVAAIAVSSIVSEMAKGKTLKEAKSITKKAAAEALDGLPKEKMHCSNLGAEALAEAIKDYEEKKYGKPKPDKIPSKQKQPKMHVQCGRCGVQNPTTANFCMNCGEKVTL